MTGTCPNCSNIYPLHSGVYGKKAQCNSCGHVFVIPNPDVMPTPHIREATRVTTPSSTVASAPSEHELPHKHQTSHRRTPSNGAGWKIAVALIALLLVVLWRVDSGEPSRGSSSSGTSSGYLLGNSPHTTSGQSRFAESDARREIQVERTRYAASQKTALASTRKRREESLLGEAQRHRLRQSTLSLEILRRERILRMHLSKPREPVFIMATYLTRQRVLDYVEDYKKWGEEQRSLRLEIFALEDELAELTEVSSYTGATTMLSKMKAQRESRMHRLSKSF